MQGAGAQPNQLITYAISFAIILVVFAIRWRRMARERPLKVEQLWIFPTLYAVLAIYMFWRFPPTGWGWLFSALAVAVGAGFGWQRGKMMRITVDPATHAINQKASPWAPLFLLLLIGVRSGARSMLAGGDGGMLHLNAMAVTDILIAFALGMFTAQRVEMYLRAKALLAEARARA